ncbi:unnamed protein product [Cylicocyclus nassatus]|uniref:Smr domain-containing protein n=1 Tax=Cylicocyclus nassatus TaxID=53992 RepID=A0AA36M7I2_CYLNA|nr:unnamed protein product [Cylicocyclus nassatus]
MNLHQFHRIFSDSGFAVRREMAKVQRHVQCYDAYAPLEKIQRCIRDGHHVMVLMRGIPGSGKTYLAKFLASNYGGIICSTDDFFMENGEYRFKGEKLEEYHRSNILRVREAMKDGIKPIIVDNTNIHANHMEQYAFHAVTNCYEIFVLEPETSWKYVARECFRRNVHGVDKSKIQAMLDSLEEQGRPSLSQLVGKGRQVKLEPPCEPAEDGSGEPALPISSASIVIAAPNNICPLSLEVSVDDRPPGLPDPSPNDILAKLFPQNGVQSSPQSPAPVSLSLAPDPRPRTRVVEQRDMATQTNEVLVTLTCAGITCDLQDTNEGSSYTIERLKDPKIRMKDRVTKMEIIPQISELDVLVAIFPHEEVNNLTHYYQMLGFDGCVKLLVELGTYVDWSASVTEGAFVEELAAAEMSGTCPHAPPPRTDWQRIAEQEGMNEKKSAMSPAQPVQLEALAEANFVSIKFGTDVLQKMSVIFGDGSPVEEECNVSVPLWLLEQLYLVWQGDYRQMLHAHDAQLASVLQEHENEEPSFTTVKKQMTVAQKLNLNELIKDFRCDAESVRRIYEDNKYDAAATRVTLHLMLNPDDEIENVEKILTSSQRTNQVPPPPLVPPCAPRPEASLSLAQQQALHYQRQANEFAAKRESETRKAQGYIRSGLHPAALVCQQNARDHGENERLLRKKAADIIVKAHENSSFLDLHLLNQKDALALLRERLEQLDRHESLRNGRSDRRLRVITGYGKSNGGRAVIKPAVESYLKRKNYTYCFLNMGEIMIYCK